MQTLYINKHSFKHINTHEQNRPKNQRNKRWKDKEDRLILHCTQGEKPEATSK